MGRTAGKLDIFLEPFTLSLNFGGGVFAGRRSPVVEVSDLRPQSSTLGRFMGSLSRVRLNPVI
ncbi:hypothetical protein [Synechocystis salina]|uniref:Uncharacterized protein n=1 Tax=Synechocystis salina LEGE 00031 TaxID=1828736 RepID=A0ABR9VUC3_9SYNC|nr:hypothetical protein [Synechocystis salina]MBE9254965.1 hypothetical protein [Synechocystis salina LEGE 00031]